MNIILKNILRYTFYFITIIIFIIIVINFYVLSFSSSKIFNSIENISGYEIGLVLGASVKANRQPSDILKDRLDVAIDAYKNGKIKYIIVSGDNSESYYNEPQVMEKYLIEYGVLEKDIYKDYAGFDTYDSIYRAKEIFGVNNLVIFTQKFHLKRAIYIASRLGINSIGVKTDLNVYKSNLYFEFREIFSRIKAFLEADILKVETKYDKDVKIEIK